MLFRSHHKIPSGNWASQQPTDTSVLCRSPPQQLLHNHSQHQPKNVSLLSSDKTAFVSQSAINSHMPQQSVYSVVLQHPPHQMIDSSIDSSTQRTAKSPQKRVSNTPLTSPRPGILGFLIIQYNFYIFLQLKTLVGIIK